MTTFEVTAGILHAARTTGHANGGARQCALRPPTLSRSTWCERRAPALWGRGEVQFDRLAAGARARLDREFLQAGLEDERRDPLSAWRSFQNRIDSAYEQHCLGTPNSGRSYARRAHASRFCPRSWMSPLGRFDIGRTRAATRRRTSPLRSTGSNGRLIDTA